MEITKKQKNNLLEFLNRTQLVGKEAITLINLMNDVANAKEVSTDDQAAEYTRQAPAE